MSPEVTYIDAYALSGLLSPHRHLIENTTMNSTAFRSIVSHDNFLVDFRRLFITFAYSGSPAHNGKGFINITFCNRISGPCFRGLYPRKSAARGHSISIPSLYGTGGGAASAGQQPPPIITVTITIPSPSTLA